MWICSLGKLRDMTLALRQLLGHRSGSCLGWAIRKVFLQDLIDLLNGTPSGFFCAGIGRVSTETGARTMPIRMAVQRSLKFIARLLFLS